MISLKVFAELSQRINVSDYDMFIQKFIDTLTSPRSVLIAIALYGLCFALITSSVMGVDVNAVSAFKG